MAKSKLIIISSRLPITVSKKNGVLEFVSSTGGLATAVTKVNKSRDSLWIGWPGIAAEELTAKEKQTVINELKKHKCHPVFLKESEIENYYSGYSNATLWPLFHYFADQTAYSGEYWEEYKSVNKIFYKETKKFVDENVKIWVHDYQLMLLPKLLRESHADANIGYFLHTPFPSFEIFRLLPEREAILKGLLGANLVGFHTYDYARHFLSSVVRILGHKNYFGTIEYENRQIKVDAFPISIDYERFMRGSSSRKVKSIVKNLDVYDKNYTVVLSVDRADYSKGIPARLDAFESFLNKYPEYKEKVKLVLIAVPSRGDVEAYQKLREDIEIKVSRINGEHATAGWVPINYRYQALPQDELIALYSASDVMLVTPHRDGMNLVAKEYVATHHNRDGVLVLSEMAGAASELPEAILVNPNDANNVADAIKKSLDMPVKEQKRRMKLMQKRVATYDINRWAKDYLKNLDESSGSRSNQTVFLSQKETNNILKEYKNAERRLILLDYDGTLKSFVASPDKALAKPTTKVKRLIKRMTDDEKNQVYIISGRPKNVMESFFENAGLGLVAEHGGWIFEAGTWISLFEEKDFSLVWHYRNVTPDLAFVRKHELMMELNGVLSDSDIGVFEGEKIIEVKPKQMHKGAIVTEILSSDQWDFILCVGDDYTDEDMFKVLPERAHTIHVGTNDTAARYSVKSVGEVVSLLNQLRG